MRIRVVLVVPVCSDDKAKRKAMSTAYSFPGVESIAVDMKAQNKLTVTGDNLDSVGLTRALRKSCGFAELVSVSPAEEEPESKNSRKQQHCSSQHPLPILAYHQRPPPNMHQPKPS